MPEFSAGSVPARKRTPLWAKVTLCVVGLVVVLAILIPNTNTQRVLVEQCRVCFAVRRTSESGLWLYDHRVLPGSKAVSIDDARATDLRPILSRPHEHRWGFGGMGFRCLGLSVGVACGSPGFNPVALAIRNDPAAMERVRGEKGSGRFGEAEVAEILDLPPAMDADDARSESRVRVYARGQELLRAIGAEEAPGWGPPGERALAPGCPLKTGR